MSLHEDLRELADNPVTYGQETHGELHADALAHIERCDEAIRKILEGSEPVRHQGMVEAARIYNEARGLPTTPKTGFDALSDADNAYFQCPACGVSFEVKSETSERIFCSGACRRLTS